MSDKRPTGAFQAPILCSSSFGSGIYLNTDGSVRLEDSFAAVARVVRNQNGEWITSLIGSWTDNLEVVTAIQESLTEGSNLGLIKRILQLLFQICHWNICHIPREENQKADRLAKLAHLDSQGLCIFEISSFGDL
ncbi:hypothetical protein Goarm_014065, partial [Gossypium armourianum]|nr:hypothetical protein [Gossypium armourianum]